MKVFITGATGIVGCEIVHELLRPGREVSIVALMRGTPDENELKRRWLLQWSEVSRAEHRRLQVVAGDMTLPGLGLAARDRAHVESTTAIIHAGAVTRFDQSAEAAVRNNVTSTANVLDLARSCRGLDRVAILSTAYVAGQRSGTILEDDLDFDAGFNNEYEQSKALAECEARRAMADLPIAILRLSIVLGRRSDGIVSRLSGLYPILRLFHNGLLAMFPGDPDQLLDLIPSDYAARAICHLVGRAFTPGATYHVCAGRDHSLRLGDLFTVAAACIGAVDPKWQRRGQPLPLAVEREVFRDFIQIVEMTGNPRLREIIQQTQTLTRLLDSPKIFDTSRFDHAIAPGGPMLSHAREWLRPVIARAVETRWRNPVRRVDAEPLLTRPAPVEETFSHV